MATTKIIDLIKEVQILLQDELSVRWPREELLNYLLDAQLAVVNRRPDANMTTATISMVEGTRQTLPVGGIRLIRVVRNMQGRAVREVPIQILDDQLPNWHLKPTTPATEIELFCYDVTNPKVFYVYPYPAANVDVEAVYSSTPDISVTISDWDTDATVIGIDDSYKNALIDWVLYRAYSKDADYAANSQRAQLHFKTFELSLQDKTQADVSATPQTPVQQNSFGTNP